MSVKLVRGVLNHHLVNYFSGTPRTRKQPRANHDTLNPFDLKKRINLEKVAAPLMLRYAHETALLSTNGAATHLVKDRSP